MRYPHSACRAKDVLQVLKAHDPSQRSDVFKRALEVGKQSEATNRALLLRMKLLQADLIVKEPKNKNANREEA